MGSRNFCAIFTVTYVYSHSSGFQPVYSASVLAEMMRPDGSSTVSVLSGESLSAELAHELMSIQVINNFNQRSFYFNSFFVYNFYQGRTSML